MSQLTSGDAHDLLAAYKRAWEKRDVDGAMELYSEDAEHRDHPFRDPFVGSNAIRGMWNDIALNERHVEFDAERVWVSGATILASWHGAYTDSTNGDRVRMRGFMTVELDEERKVRRLREWPLARVVGRDSTLRPEPVGTRAGEGPRGG
jgi:ketosteroid isomerase-like protein